MSDETRSYRLLPGLARGREKDAFSVSNSTFRTQLWFSRDFALVLDFFRKPRTLAEFEERFEQPPRVLLPLMQNAVLGEVTPDGVLPAGYMIARRSLEVGLSVLSAERHARPRRRFPRFGDRLPLGRTGLEVSPFILGIADRPSRVIEAFEAGINFFFLTADVHWRLYESLRRGLQKLLRARPSVRNQIVVAVPSYAKGPVGLNEVLDAVPELKHLDALVLGAAESFDFEHRLPIFDGLKRHGVLGTRSVGASFHDRGTARKAIDSRAVDIAFIRYSVARQASRTDLFTSLGPHPGTLLYAFKTRSGHASPAWVKTLGLGRNAWIPSVADHYRFCLTRPELDGILFSAVGTRMKDLLDATQGKPMSEVEERYMTDLFEMARWSVSPEFMGYAGG